MAHLYINGTLDLDIGREFGDDPKNGYKIGYNTGIKYKSGVNQHEHQLNDGLSYWQHNANKSRRVTCTHIFTDEEADEGIVANIDSLINHMKTNALPLIVYNADGEGGNGKIIASMIAKVVDYDRDLGIDGLIHLDFDFAEHKEPKSSITTFDTFNKKTTTKPKTTTAVKAPPSYIKDLYTCKPVKAKDKFKIPCVTSLQKMLQSDGKYLKYIVDGQFWIYTEQELKAWQKDVAKVKATGTWTSDCVAYLKKKYGTGNAQ